MTETDRIKSAYKASFFQLETEEGEIWLYREEGQLRMMANNHEEWHVFETSLTEEGAKALSDALASTAQARTEAHEPSGQS